MPLCCLGISTSSESTDAGYIATSKTPAYRPRQRRPGAEGFLALRRMPLGGSFLRLRRAALPRHCLWRCRAAQAQRDPAATSPPPFWQGGRDMGGPGRQHCGREAKGSELIRSGVAQTAALWLYVTRRVVLRTANRKVLLLPNMLAPMMDLMSPCTTRLLLGGFGLKSVVQRRYDVQLVFGASAAVENPLPFAVEDARK